MVYLDNAATTIKKPQQVSETVAYAINHFGNSGRSFCDPSIEASKTIFDTRKNLSCLFNLDSPNQVSFTSSSTESFNLLIHSLISEKDTVLTTIFEHNSVLRPLYSSNCELIFLEPNEICVKNLEKILLKNPEISFFFCTHGSNVTGTVFPIFEFYQICKKYNVCFIVDISQTAGSISVDGNHADFLCFTGHKGLFGPQGTGGILSKNEFPNLPIIKTGGSGYDTFSHKQKNQMPDLFEAGTLNSHSIAGLNAGVEWILSLSVNKIHSYEQYITNLFLELILPIKNIMIYSINPSLPIISIQLGLLSSEELSLILYEQFDIITRSGFHCAPLLHEYFHTELSGMTRFSFSYFTTKEEIFYTADALKQIASQYNS